MTERSAADEEIMRRATEEWPVDGAGDLTGDVSTGGKPKDDTLELGGEEAPKVEETDEQKPDEEAEKKTRSQRWEKRVDNLTARLREAERRAAEAEARVTPAANDDGEKAPDPNDPKYEFGEADPAFLKDYARFEVRQTLAEERKKSDEAQAATAKQSELSARIATGMTRAEAQGKEKYPDFEEKLAEAIEARNGEPLDPLLSVGISVSPVAGDVTYRLMTDEATTDRIEKLAKTNAQAAALAFGELEGEYLPVDHDDSDLNFSDPLDRLRMDGRMKARIAGRGGKGIEQIERKKSKAPEPPDNRSRGAAGKFEVEDDTSDFAAFERKYMGKRG